MIDFGWWDNKMKIIETYLFNWIIELIHVACGIVSMKLLIPLNYNNSYFLLFFLNISFEKRHKTVNCSKPAINHSTKSTTIARDTVGQRLPACLPPFMNEGDFEWPSQPAAIETKQYAN